MRRRVLGGAVLSALVLVGASAAAPPTISASCTPDPGDCGAWHREATTVNWVVTNFTSATCDGNSVTSDGSSTRSCTATNNDGTTTLEVVVRVDATAPQVTGASASRGPDGGGWYRSSVGVSFSGTDATSGIGSCTSASYSGPDSASASLSGTCTDVAGNTSAPSSFSLKYDSTPPSASASASRGPDSNGWYSKPVGVTVSGSDALSGVSACASPSYSGPDTAGVSVGGTCVDNAGNASSPATVTIRYDATPPQTAVAPERPPDSGEWYTKQVAITWSGSDGVSGVESCNALTYSGPDTPTATVTGVCRDRAGNTSAPSSFSFRYDATPPKLTKAEVRKGDRFVTVSWTATGGVVSSEIARAEGAVEPTVVYRGAASSFTDRSVKNGIKYRYILTVADEAGNTDRTTLTALPRPPLYQPARGARVRGAVTLAWEKVPKATYYNLQLHRRVRGRWVKVLTRWPKNPWFHLPRRWKATNGATETLVAGRYRWYVWPAYGPRSAARYGKLEGSSEFVAVA